MTSGAHSNMGQSSPPHHLPSISHPASPPSKRDLKSWWKNFKLPSKQHDTQHDNRGPGIFGVPLRTSITYANVAISLVDENGQSYIYGYVPIVVAKCGVFLKEKATGIEGIFRLSGSEKRIKELKTIFDSADRYGKGLVWDGYTVHDAANVLRRYLNDLPEPVVPLDLYEKFRDPLRGATKQAVGDTEGPQFVDNFDETTAIDKYQTLITELPPLNKQLLLYILDLLAVFAAKSDENRMTSQNLAAIFQPGMLSHPAHAMAPDEYRLNQCVIIFLIENQDHFLIGMQGTAADEKMMKEVASGTPNGPLTPNPNRKSGLGRTASNSSAGAESVRRDGKVRRNRSVSSRHSHSRADGSVTPNSPAGLTTTTPTGGLARSNTVPSKKSPALRGANKFNKYESPSRPPRSPSLEPLSQLHPDEENLTVAGWSDTSRPSLSRSQDRLLEVPREVVTPTKERGSSPNLPHHIFQRSPHEGGTDKRQPNKLRKKRIPGSMSISAQSSCASLQPALSDHASPAAEAPNPLESPPIAQPQARPLSPSLPDPHPGHADHRVAGHRSSQPPPQRVPQPLEHDSNGASSAEPSHRHSRSLGHVRSDGMLKSSPPSLHSSLNEGSDDTDQVAEGLPASTAAEHVEKEKKNRWRLSRSKRDELAGTSNIGANHHAEASTTSIASAVNKPAKSCHGGDSSEHLSMSMSGERVVSHDGGMFGPRDDAKGPFSWIKNKYREAKENAEQRRAKSPPPETHAVFGSGNNMVAPRAGSLDLKRDSTLEDERRTLRQVTREEQMGEEDGVALQHAPDEVIVSHEGVKEEEEAPPVPLTAVDGQFVEVLRHEDGAV